MNIVVNIELEKKIEWPKNEPLMLVLRIEVNEVIPHFPTVPADLAADGLLLFSLNNLSNCMLPGVTLFTLRLYDLVQLRDVIFLFALCSHKYSAFQKSRPTIYILILFQLLYYFEQRQCNWHAIFTLDVFTLTHQSFDEIVSDRRGVVFFFFNRSRSQNWECN